MNDSVRPTGHPQQTCMLIDPEEETQKPDPMCTRVPTRTPGLGQDYTRACVKVKPPKKPMVNPGSDQAESGSASCLSVGFNRVGDLLSLRGQRPGVGLALGLSMTAVGDQPQYLKPGQKL
jgi:hypothetical protein